MFGRGHRRHVTVAGRSIPFASQFRTHREMCIEDLRRFHVTAVTVIFTVRVAGGSS
jgi:hypothetical protein